MWAFPLFFGAVVLAGNIPTLPIGPPLPAPKYMVDNERNTFQAAPDRGILNGPVTGPIEMSSLKSSGHATTKLDKRAGGDFWIDEIEHGKIPYASGNYSFYRNVKDYGAVGDGVTDDTAAINRAASDGARCGQACGSTSVTGALVYFPAGTYLIKTPIIQYYYTQFVGDPNNKPVIKGHPDFSGIALIDNDPYIPGGNGAQWYINQNQFYRQIRNFVIDLTAMPRAIFQGDQQYVPTGIHWQVAQATSLQNIDFKMPVSDASGSTTAVGIFMENGSGGFVSDLTFFGGNIGFRAGSQQFTARNLKFTSCLTAISMIFDWGFTWKNIDVLSCYIALDCTLADGADRQGTGSISVLDSHFNGVPYAITVRADGPRPNIVLDNLLVENSASVVLVSGGETILPGSTTGPITIPSWAMGRRYTSSNGTGSYVTGPLDPIPLKTPNLLDGSGKFFERSKPQYETKTASSFIIATKHGVDGSGTRCQTNAINRLLLSSVGKPVFFPAGVYLVEGTIHVPVGSIIVGEGWSQIMGTGSFFADERNPQVMVRVGRKGEVGSVEISDMLFTVKGATAGAILMEWNLHAHMQGSAGMWDSHFRVGGAVGSDLQLSDCPKLSGSVNPKCKAASMLLHLTPQSSGYFENVWAWVADHDLDQPPNVDSAIDIYSARGILIESQGPTWLYGTASEHNILYQYQLSGAKDIYLGHMQTETPYFQPVPAAAPQPFISPSTSSSSSRFPDDPTFADCTTASSASSCRKSWALRILKSTNTFIYSAGFYSFFGENYDQACVAQENCQKKLVEIDSSVEGLWLYNIFTKGAEEIISPAAANDGYANHHHHQHHHHSNSTHNPPCPSSARHHNRTQSYSYNRATFSPVLQKESGQIGFTSEISAWLPLALPHADNDTSSLTPRPTASATATTRTPSMRFRRLS